VKTAEGLVKARYVLIACDAFLAISTHIWPGR